MTFKEDKAVFVDNKIYMGLSDEGKVTLSLSMANRHGLISGASGTGKTVTMKVMAEAFSDAGVPVFLCDVKGDVSGICAPGAQSDGMEKRIDKFGIRDCFEYKAYPTCFWDIYGEKGHPVRATVSDMGPDLLSRILGLTPAQEGVLNIVFKIADDNGLMLIDLKDIRAMLSYVSEHRADFIEKYGNIAPQSIGGIMRALIPLEGQGGDVFFGEPALDIRDWIRCGPDGKGIINVLDCVKLVQNPTLYASFLLWLIAELFENLPEVGDCDKPKIVFFFDEAHLLFNGAPKVLVSKIEQVVKLIRSKGVGVYFVTQSPSDIPDTVLAQLSGKVQHALRAYTPNEQKAVKAAANSMRPNPNFKSEEVILELGVGQALISFLDDDGVPQPVQKTAVICPQSLMAPADDALRKASLTSDGMSRYDKAYDGESAYEVLEDRKAVEQEQKKLADERDALEKEREAFEKQKQKEAEREQAKREKAAERRKTQIERQLINTGAQVLKRGIMNTLFGKR